MSAPNNINTHATPSILEGDLILPSLSLPSSTTHFLSCEASFDITCIQQMLRSSTHKQTKATKRPTNNQLVQKQTGNTHTKPLISPRQSHMFLQSALHWFMISIPILLPPTNRPLPQSLPLLLRQLSTIIIVYTILRHGLVITCYCLILRVVGDDGVIIGDDWLGQWRFLHVVTVVVVVAMVVVAKIL